MSTLKVTCPDIRAWVVVGTLAAAGAAFGRAEGVEADASNPADDGGTAALTEEADMPVRRELTEYIGALDVDEQDALVALAWIGRGDFEASDWRAAVREAAQRRETSVARYLLGMPMLPDYLEDALSAYDRSCADLESRL